MHPDLLCEAAVPLGLGLRHVKLRQDDVKEVEVFSSEVVQQIFVRRSDERAWVRPITHVFFDLAEEALELVLDLKDGIRGDFLEGLLEVFAALVAGEVQHV